MPEIDTTVASQSIYTKALASGDNFREVCGEVIVMGQDRPIQSPPLISNLLWGAFCYPTDIDFRGNQTPYFTLWCLSLPDCWQRTHRTFKCHFFCNKNSHSVLSRVCLSHLLICLIPTIIQDAKIAENMSKSTKIQYSRQPTASSRQSAQSASRFRCCVQCIVGKTTDFPNLKTKASD